MHKNIYFFCFFLLLFSCKKDDEPVDISSQVEVLKIIQAEKNIQNLNSVAFCVVKDDEILWANAIGYANRGKKITATPETRYIVASISKTITAVAAMQLYEKGLLDLDADVNIYLPFTVKNPTYPNQKITPRMLLCHSGSISDDWNRELNLNCFGFDYPQPLGDFLNDFFTEGRQYYSTRNYYDYSPGEKANYSNVGFSLIGYLVERVSGQDFDAYCKANIFIPLGMTKSEWYLKNTPQDELAIPYSPLLTGVSQSPHFTSPYLPAANLRTTVTDLSKFLRAIIMNGSFNGYQMLKPETIQQMKTAVNYLQTGRFKMNYGLGMYYREIGKLNLLGHDGAMQGVASNMMFDPNTHVGAIVITNTTGINNTDLIVNSLIQYGNTK
ncbi:MAG: serine hydrolase [Bacteroidota bacterium]|nr:serine hydrolase [Bacteroidota bacterium]